MNVIIFTVTIECYYSTIIFQYMQKSPYFVIVFSFSLKLESQVQQMHEKKTRATP